MAEKLKAYWEKAKVPLKKLEVLKKVPKKIYVLLGVLLAVALGLAIWLNTRPYEVLFTDLNSSEMSSILSYLKDEGVTEYKVEGNDTILVPAKKEATLKAGLLMEGYPQSGFAYTYSEGGSALSTEAERNAAAIRDLQDRLGAVIRCFDGVRDAVVNINTGEDMSYVLDSDRVVKASASVFVQMKDTMRLTNEQAKAIRNLVAHSVKGLEIDSVSITDALGNNYGSGDAEDNNETSALKLRLEQEWENKIRTTVLQVLSPFYGDENVRVGVNCIVDVSRTVENNTDVYLPEWADDGETKGRGIIGKQIYNYAIVRDDEKTAGGTVGTSTNSEFPEYVEDLPELNGNESEITAGGQTDYDNSRSEKHIVRTAGYLADCTIAVSINSGAAENVDIPSVTQHIARAAGITGSVDNQTGSEYLNDKISVIVEPFYEAPALPIQPQGPIEMWMIYAAAAGLLLFLILLIVILAVHRKRKKKKLAALQAEQENIDMDAFMQAAAAYAGNGQENGADVMSIQSERSIELRQSIRKFAEENPEIAAQMLKSWLRGDDDNG